MPLTPEEIKKIDEDFVKLRKQWQDRKKVYKELVQHIESLEASSIIPSLANRLQGKRIH